MLAATLEPEDLKTVIYPVFCTPKLDGIRCLKNEGKAVSRKFKSIPNTFIRTNIEKFALEGFDGEIIIEGMNWNERSSAIMSEDGEPDFTYMVFDYCQDPSEGYNNRMRNLFGCIHEFKFPHINCLFPVQINNEAELLLFEKQCLSEGHEGIMLRSPSGPYKFGRSTPKERYLMKFKRFTDGEAIILSVYEKMHNTNKATIDALGHSKRSSHLAGQIPAGTLGGFWVRDIKSGQEFGVGTGEGLNDELRATVWSNQTAYIGKILKFKSQESGAKNKPRFGTFIGFRDERDM